MSLTNPFHFLMVKNFGQELQTKPTTCQMNFVIIGGT